MGWGNPYAARESLMSWRECKYCGVAWGWLEFLLHPERPERAQSLRVQSRGFTRSIKLTIELPEHPDDKLPQRLGKERKHTKDDFNIHKATLTLNCVWSATDYCNEWISSAGIDKVLFTMCPECILPVACSALQASWTRRRRVLENCSLRQKYWRTGTGSPWCSERRWT